MFSTLTPINDAGVLLWDPPSTAKLHEVNDLHAVSTARGLHIGTECIREAKSRKLNLESPSHQSLHRVDGWSPDLVAHHPLKLVIVETLEISASPSL